MPAPRGRIGLSVVPVVLLVALAFLIGSVGTATAGGLTKGSVKKIAAKVVKQQAASLSVKHAVSADSALNADKVGGQTAAQLGVRPIVFTLPEGQAYPTVKSWTLSGVAAGSYLVSLHMIVGALPAGTAINFAECTVHNVTTDDYPLAIYQIAAPARVPSLNGTGYATVAAGDHLVLGCNANAGWMPAYDGHLTLTPVASATPGTLTAP